MNDRCKGLCITLVGILSITPDAVVVRFLSSNGADPWTIVFWKMTFSIVLTGGYAWYECRQQTSIARTVLNSKGLYAAAVLPQAAVNAAFTFSLVHTSAAHALLLINLNPLWCALLGRVVLGERLPPRTIVALLLAMGCMLLIFVPEIVRNQESETQTGNIISVCTGVGIAVYITFVRKGAREGRNMIAVSPLAAILTALFALGMRRGRVTPGEHWTAGLGSYWLGMMAEGVMVGIVFIAITIAPRLITGSEVALVLLLEVLLAPLWVYWAYRSERPSVWTLVGGLLLVGVLALHELVPLCRHPTETKAATPEKQQLQTSDVTQEQRTEEGNVAETER